MNPICERCGLCCDGYTVWMTNRSYDDDPKEIKRLMEYHGIKPIKNAQGELGIHIPGKCVHFEWVDGKASCKINDTKPVVCREYFCAKAIALGEKIEELANGVHVR